MSRPATPKQIAYFNYMGVKKAHRMSFDEASALFDKLLEADDKLLSSMGFKSYEAFHDRKSQWFTERFILHPALYADEIQNMLDYELPDLLHTYARGQVVGASERLTKPKIKKVIDSLLGESEQWWQSKNRNQIFFQRLSELYPDCVDGRAPDKRKPKKNNKQKSKDQSKKSSCGCLVIIILIILVALYAYSRIQG
ncbi:MAG: hypothetical protein ACSHX6_03485 [Akkermansiaceae bacterium]